MASYLAFVETVGILQGTLPLDRALTATEDVTPTAAFIFIAIPIAPRILRENGENVNKHIKLI